MSDVVTKPKMDKSDKPSERIGPSASVADKRYRGTSTKRPSTKRTGVTSRVSKAARPKEATTTQYHGRPENTSGVSARAVKSHVDTSIWTPANIVTCVRIVCVPVWLTLAEFTTASNIIFFNWKAFLIALLYMAISLTDKIDGYLARSRDEVTTFGKFLDPIADKLVVIVALCFLLEKGWLYSWILLVIIAREFLVSGLRMVVSSKGIVIAASNLGKWKTATTMIAISGILIARSLPYGWLFSAVWTISTIILAAAIILTVWSGIDYFMKSWSYVVED